MTTRARVVQLFTGGNGEVSHRKCMQEAILLACTGRSKSHRRLVSWSLRGCRRGL
jgi:hypothetical protein